MSSTSSEQRGLIGRLGSFVASLVPREHASNPAFDVFDRLRHIHEAPLRNVRHSIWWIRKTFFTKPRSETPAYLVDLTKPEIMALFGRHYFEPGWELSYNYMGEVLNIRRVEYNDESEYAWWQVHIRGYHHAGGGIELAAHYETEPTEHPHAHIDLEGLETTYGMAVVGEILDEEGIDYEHLDPSETDITLEQDSVSSPSTDPVEPPTD